MSGLLVAVVNLEELEAQRALAVATASSGFEARIDQTRATRDELLAALKAFYYAHLGEVERDGKKSVQLANGVMGRRDNPPKLAPKNRSWTWAAILICLREKFGDRFLRSREPEIDKDRVKAEIAPDDLGNYGLKLDQEETFFAEPARLPGVK